MFIEQELYGRLFRDMIKSLAAFGIEEMPLTLLEGDGQSVAHRDRDTATDQRDQFLAGYIDHHVGLRPRWLDHVDASSEAAVRNLYMFRPDAELHLAPHKFGRVGAVSGAVVVDGKALVGASGSAGEMGHIVVDPHGPLCRCGNRGCLELYCGAGFVSKMAADWLGRTIPVDEIVSRAVQGETGFRRLLADAGEAAGRGLSMVGAMINPPLFIISGVLASAGELLLAPLRSSYEKHSFVKREDVDEAHYPVFKAGKFLDNDNCLGAAGLVLRHSSRLR